MKKLAIIFGTRPDTIKLAPVVLELRKYPQFFSIITIATAQHRTMLDDVLSVFEIVPDHDLNVMTEQQSLSLLTQTLIVKLDEVLGKEKPDMVIVQGDTATTFAASLTAFYHKIPVVHVEAGLRTRNKFYPFPEEIFRRLTSHTADIHCAPTLKAVKDLRNEGISKETIFCTGNTVIDALRIVLGRKHDVENPVLRNLFAEEKKIVVITMHRRENWGEPMKEVCNAVRDLANLSPDMHFVFPVHLNPVVREVVTPILSGITNVHLIEPLNYSDFAQLLSRSHFVISDSGGLQEEAPSLGVPVLVLREVTERPEAVTFGTVKLVGTDKVKILQYALKLLRDKKFYNKMSRSVNPYGDGKASERIVAALLHHFGYTKKRMKEFLPRGYQK
ncbi:MAG: UDP-N-acetylglucosamine 2-epimerase (non-hydrolyzing) [Bacteroidota bacterium]